jgi:hypothetical protein
MVGPRRELLEVELLHEVVRKGNLVPQPYIGDDFDPQAIAARVLAARYQLEPHLAHLICRLAGLGNCEAAR